LKRILLLLSACAIAALAQDNKLPMIPHELLGKATAPAPARKKAEAQAAQPQAAVADTVVSDGYELQVSADAPLTIGAGQFHIFDQSQLDFTGLDHARIALQTVNGQDATSVGIMVFWAAAGTYFNATDLLIGGGALGSNGVLSLYTPTYGPILKLGVVNGGSTAVQIKQLSIYAK
jgi:hypothetical protein